MLTAFTLNNFKSYKSARLPLGPLTIMIGANASGKSNAIEGLRLLSWLAQGHKLSNIQHAVQDSEQVVRGRITDLGYSDCMQFELGCETSLPSWSQLRIGISLRGDSLHITSESITNPDGQVPLYLLDQPSTGLSSDVRVAYNNFSRGINPHVTCSDQVAIFTQMDNPARFQASHKKAQDKIPPVVKKYQDWLSNILFLDPIPAQMRTYSFTSEKRLQSDGKHLSSVLFALWEGINLTVNENKTPREHILEFIRSLPEQDILGLDFIQTSRSEVMVQLIETFGGMERRYDAPLLSDGTLRVLAIAAAMLSAPEGGLVVIEEIDNGVHPSRARHLLEQIQRIATERSLRVLLSTHNPAMLDALPDSAIPDVVFCYRAPDDGSSCMVQMRAIPDSPELLSQGSLGYLMTSGVLERFVKFHSGPEQRKAKALAWLDSLRSPSDSEGGDSE